MHTFPAVRFGMALAAFCALGVACGASDAVPASFPPDDSLSATRDGGAAGSVLPKVVGHYTQSCDGSGAISFGDDYFLNFNDENQVLRLYRRGTDGPAMQEFDISAALGMTTSDEADLEDAARVGNRIFALGSHGRKKSGTLDASRYKFFALDVTGAAPALSMHIAGVSSHLLSDMLVSSNWASPDSSAIDVLTQSSQLQNSKVPSLAPKQDGTNIEGLGALPGGRLAIGFRNPRPKAKALIVTLLNPDAVVTGSTAQFGEAIELDLGGEGIRGMAWSPVHAAMLLLSGPRDTETGPFALWKWSGKSNDAAVKVTDVVPPAGGPEAIVLYPGKRDVQVLFDMSSAPVGSSDCGSASVAQKSFSDVILHVE